MAESWKDGLEAPPCPNGCAPDDELVLVGRDRLHGLPGEFPIVRCRGCGLMRTSPRPGPAAMGPYYPDDYGPYVGTRVAAGGGSGGRLRQALRRAYHLLFDYRTHPLPPAPPGHALEIGCASGAFLRELAGRGWEVEGIEFSPDAAASARAAGFRVQSGAVEEARPPERPLDLVVGWMVVEHLHQPAEVLAKLAGWSRPGAWLAISVPDAGCGDFSWFGPSAYALHLPNHLFHFTPATLGALLARSGWRVERVLHQRTLGNWLGGLAFALEDRGAPAGLVAFLRRVTSRPRLSAPLLYPLACLLAAIGQTGRMTVWARRIDGAGR